MTTPLTHDLPEALLGLEAVIFDGDGVLFDTESLCFEAFCDTVVELFGQPWTLGQVHDFVGVSDRDITAALNTRFGMRVDHEIFHRRKHELYQERIARHGLRAIEGAVATVQMLVERSVPLALASSAPPHKIAQNLERTGLRDMGWKSVISGETLPRSKPAPDIFLLSAERLGVPPGRCLVVEDAPAGVRAARAAGCPCLALTTTLPASYLQPCQPTAIVASHSELQQFLRAIFG